jgi:DNA polymerase-3 subunit alpha/error-prone DNA polymerase
MTGGFNVLLNKSIESPAMRQLQKKTEAGDFAHIVIHSSIIRPAANKFLNEYVRRLKGGAWEPLHPRLARILDETYGILCYQEDVSKAAVALAGFDEAEADTLRKVIAKKAGGAKLAAYKKQFFEGSRRNGIEEKTIQAIWAMMLSFDGYSFCKPHSASYAMVSYQSAYLRVHHPAPFMAAVLSNQGGYYRPHAYIAECRRMGLIVDGQDINQSRWRYYGHGRFVVVGFMAIKGLSRSGADMIIDERDRRGEYKSLTDFTSRVKLGRDDIIALCPAGVFDSIAQGIPRTHQARALLKANTGTARSVCRGTAANIHGNGRPFRRDSSGKAENRCRGAMGRIRRPGLFAEAAPPGAMERQGITGPEDKGQTDCGLFGPLCLSDRLAGYTKGSLDERRPEHEFSHP